MCNLVLHPDPNTQTQNADPPQIIPHINKTWLGAHEGGHGPVQTTTTYVLQGKHTHIPTNIYSTSTNQILIK